MQARELKVKAHEMRHKSALGPYGGRIHYEYDIEKRKQSNHFSAKA